MKKRGQGIFGLSYGVIFSIIIIIAIISVAFFSIRHFLNLSRCSEVGFFFTDLQDEVDRAWTSGIYRGNFVGSLPEGIEEVCFGDVNLAALTDTIHLTEFKKKNNAKVFLSPPQKACDGELYSYNLEHADFSDFFCAVSNNNQIVVRFDKESTDSKVKISRIS